MGLPELSQERNVELSVLNHLRGEAAIAQIHVYESWDDAVAAIDTPAWQAPAMTVELLYERTAIPAMQGAMALYKPYTFAVSFFGRAEGPGARQERDNYLGVLRKRLMCEDIAFPSGRQIEIKDQMTQGIMGYAEVQEVTVRPLSGEGRPPRERYRGEIVAQLRFFHRKVTWYGS